MLTIHLRINDSADNQPTPVRVRITDSQGNLHVPFGRFALFPCGKGESLGGQVRLGEENFFYIDGSCEIPLPAGVPLRIQVFKGPEYEPLEREVVLKPGQMALRLSVERLADFRPAGWFSGDIRAHYIPPAGAALEAGAEGLDFVNLLAHVDYAAGMDGHLYPSVPNLLTFTGQVETRVAVNTLNTHPVLGHVGLLNSHRPVFPLAFGGADATDDWSICDWCDQCHRKGGLTVWVRPFESLSRFVGGEALVALILGKIDAIECDPKPRTTPLLPAWYRLLNAGFFVPLIGASGKETNGTALGAMRTYAKLNPDEPLTYRAWIEAVRAGRCFATNGPFLTLEDGKATAVGRERFDALEIVADGRAIARTEPEMIGDRWVAKLDSPSLPENAGWIAARCPGPSGFAHASATVLNPNKRDPEALKTLSRFVEKTREWIEEYGRFAELRRKHHLLELCDRAIAALEGPSPP